MDDIPLAPESPKRGGSYSGAKVPGHAAGPQPPRRNFLVGFFAAVIGGLVGLVPLAAGLLTYLDPIRRTKVNGTAIPLTTLDSIPDATNGTVLIGQFPVLNDRIDAWNLYPDERIGSVYLVVPKGSDQVKALNTICPHLGCAVDTQQTPEGTRFYCPCHTSAFNLDGERFPNCVAPRSMDDLKCEQVKGPDGRVNVSVVFKNFQPGLAEKKEKS